MSTLPLKELDGGISFAVRVVPRAGRTMIAGRRGEALLVRLAAAPVDGAANEALIGCLASTFECPRRDVTIVSGLASRNKRITLAGLTVDQVAARLSAILRRVT